MATKTLIEFRPIAGNNLKGLKETDCQPIIQVIDRVKIPTTNSVTVLLC